jgi:hypothetical protein
MTRSIFATVSSEIDGSRGFPNHHLSGFDRKVDLSEGVRKMGPANAHGRPQTAENGMAVNWYDMGIQKLPLRLQKCIDRNGDYVEK